MSVRVVFDNLTVGKYHYYVRMTWAHEISDAPSGLAYEGLSMRTNPAEKWCATLDGSASLINGEGSNGVWSEDISTDLGYFTKTQQLSISVSKEADGSGDAVVITDGLSLVFDDINYIYPTKVDVLYYAITDGTTILVAQKSYDVSDTSVYLPETVQGWNFVNLSFDQLNMPKCRLRLRKIALGGTTIFTDSAVEKVSVTQETSSRGDNLPSGECNIDLRLPINATPSFRKNQAFLVYTDDTLIGKFYLRTAKTKKERFFNKISLGLTDIVGILDDYPFVDHGFDFGSDLALSGLYMNLYNTFVELPIPIDYTFDWNETRMSGYLAKCSVREMLANVCLASTAPIRIDSTYRTDLYIGRLSDETVRNIGQGCIFSIFEAEENAPKTISVTTTDFDDTQIERIVGYEVTERDVGKEITIQTNRFIFNVFLDGFAASTNVLANSVTITPPSVGTIYLDVYKPVEKDYVIETKNTYSDSTLKISKCTLISSETVEDVVKKWDNLSGQVYTLKFAEYKSDVITKCNDIVDIEVAEGTWKRGRIRRQSFNLVGGFTVKEIEVEIENE